MIIRASKLTVKGFVATHDIIWQNIKIDPSMKAFKRILSYLVLLGLFFLLATPSV
jgi:hypothetical protein